MMEGQLMEMKDPHNVLIEEDPQDLEVLLDHKTSSDTATTSSFGYNDIGKYI